MGLADDRICLRNLEPIHLSAVHRWKNDFQLAPLIMAQPKPSSYADVENWLSRNQADVNQVLFGIFMRSATQTQGGQSELPIGIIRLMFIDWISRNASLGIYIGEPEFRGQGIGKAAIKLLLNYAFDQLNLHKICLKVLESNQSAIHCYKSLGFASEGLQREQFWAEGKYENVVQMGILARDYQHHQTSQL